MKLVTGIEAIQSGKPWKHKDNDEWIDPDSDTQLLTPRALQTRVYIIKEEPREFWILPYAGEKHSVTGVRADDPVDRFEKEGWIRVREIEK